MLGVPNAGTCFDRAEGFVTHWVTAAVAVVTAVEAC